MRRCKFAFVWLFACIAVLSVTASSSSTAAGTCPGPTAPQGGHCVLLEDATISETMWIPSGTHLNCRGHRLTASDSGQLDDPTTPVNEFEPATPDLAMLVAAAADVKIQNCVLVGFDFGIMVANSKSGGTKIQGNAIDVRTNGINIINSDDVLVTGNSVTYASERGRGIVVHYDSDNNRIVGNTILSTDAASTGLVRQIPGGPFVDAVAIMDNEIHVLHSDRDLLNAIVSGVLLQFSGGGIPGEPFDETGRAQDNVVEGNDILDLGGGASCTLNPAITCQSNAQCGGNGTCLLKQNSGVALNFRATSTFIRGNRLSGLMDRGISFGGVGTFLSPGWHPGRCSADPNRLCVVNADCHIPGIDSVSLGMCILQPAVSVPGSSVDSTAEGNVLSGVFTTAGLFANNTSGFAMRGNTIEGGVSGIRINSTAIGGVVERNIVSGTGNALFLMFQSPFSVVIRLNDFLASGAAIRTPNTFGGFIDVAADTGNYWGLPCPGFDPARVRFENGTVNPNVVDSKPYGAPVATARRLPTRCQ